MIALTDSRVVIGLDLLSASLTGVDTESVIQHWVWVSLQSYQPVLKRLGYQYKLWQGGRRNGHGGHHTMFHDLVEQAPSRPPTIESDPDDIALLQPTGGTTGSLNSRNCLIEIYSPMLHRSPPGWPFSRDRIAFSRSSPCFTFMASHST